MSARADATMAAGDARRLRAALDECRAQLQRVVEAQDEFTRELELKMAKILLEEIEAMHGPAT